VRALFIVTVFVSALVIRGGAQALDTSPAFDVATVKPSGPDSAPLSIQRLPSGRLVTSNTPLTMLINWAFGLDDGRLLNVPRGADSARFDIVAQPQSNPAAGQLQRMMQRLLAERFKLAVHREVRELPSYELTRDEGGLKIAVTAPTGARSANPFGMTDAGTLTGASVTADMLATVLATQLGQPVRNATGIDGVFDFTLAWRPDGVANADLQNRASLFTAIREQLGLRLEARRAPVEVIVIDRLELTPTEN
jgi:uncharacterized protein (TIGR03435 family)